MFQRQTLSPLRGTLNTREIYPAHIFRIILRHEMHTNDPVTANNTSDGNSRTSNTNDPYPDLRQGLGEEIENRIRLGIVRREAK